MKRRMILEIEYPEGYDLCWDTSVSGDQVFHDCIKLNAIVRATNAVMQEIIKQTKDDKDSTLYEEDPKYQFLQRQVDVILSSKVVGYMDGDVPLFYDPKSDTWNPVSE